MKSGNTFVLRQFFESYKNILISQIYVYKVEMENEKKIKLWCQF